ncbi:Receptor-type tyrosine-protein phosphatase F [Stylophora pistillata]|uniref:Receptor-type tyrosine-protein phosphatase F n=1 Tax=Stylophora pistillata TaxID=50429 RepID=A0A2B4RJI5_STYPI|nr:Receptor-type tyrosine-protein phosphatase F [Stylophora pistillata]
MTMFMAYVLETKSTDLREPSRGPQEVSSSAANSSKIIITWLGLPKEVAYRNIIRYQVRLSVVENCRGIQSGYYSTINATTTYVLLTGLSLCAKYEVYVRGYTTAGPGPYSIPVMVQTLAVVWSKETPSSPSISANSREGGISAKVTPPSFPGNARFYQVIIITLRSNYIGTVKPPGRFTTQDMMTYEGAHKSFVPAAYVAFQFKGNRFDKNQEFVIGDGAKSSGKERSKPFIKGLPKTTITASGELAMLTCEVIEETKASVTWSKDGLTSMPCAQLENNGTILIIKDVIPNESGVYELPPRIIEELSPFTVVCEKESPCFLSCQATSYVPFNYTWTKDGQVPTGDIIKLMNNSLIVTPQVGEDYGEYVCHVTNVFGSTLYEITLLDSEDTQSIFLASVIPLSFTVFVLLLIICGLIWQRRRAVLNKRIQSKEEIDFDGVKSSPDQQSSNEQGSDPNTYMELKPRPSNQESCVPSEYQSLREIPENPGYYNSVFQKENGGKQNEEVYEEI